MSFLWGFVQSCLGFNIFFLFINVFLLCSLDSQYIVLFHLTTRNYFVMSIWQMEINASLKFRIGEIKGGELKSVKSCTLANVQLLTKTSTRTLFKEKLVCRQTTFGLGGGDERLDILCTNCHYIACITELNAPTSSLQLINFQRLVVQSWVSANYG